jgi:hypothetical protein
MKPEQRPGQPTEGQQPFGGGKNAPQPAEPQATHGPPENHAGEVPGTRGLPDLDPLDAGLSPPTDELRTDPLAEWIEDPIVLAMDAWTERALEKLRAMRNGSTEEPNGE